MIEPPLLEYARVETPIGPVLVAGDGRAVRHVRFRGEPGPLALSAEARAGPVVAAARELQAFFRRERTAFDVPLAPAGTPFQRRVWDELQRVPYGETVSYGELARRIGQPGAARAVGAANGANPIPIIIPCHRAVGSDGSMTGFGGGIAVKRALLALESGQASLARAR